MGKGLRKEETWLGYKVLKNFTSFLPAANWVVEMFAIGLSCFTCNP